MNFANAKISEMIHKISDLNARVLNGETPQTGTTDFVAAGKYDRICAFFDVGDLEAGASGVCSLQQATDSSGSGAKALGSTVTVSTDNTGATIDARVEDMDFDNGFTFVAARCVSAVGDVPIGIALVATPKYSPATV